MKHFRKILSFARPYIKRVWTTTMFNVLYAIFNILTVLSFLPVLSILFKTDSKVEVKPTYTGVANGFDYLKDSFYYEITQYINANGVMATLALVCVICIILFFFKNLFRFLGSYELAFLTNGITKDLRNSIYKKVLILPISYFSEKRKGDLLSRITVDVQVVEVSFLDSVGSIVRDPLTIIIILIMMFAISTKLTIFVFIMLPISGLIISSLGKKLKKNSMNAQKESGRFLSFVEETLTGLRIIKGFNAEETIGRKFTDSTNSYARLMTKVIQRQKLASPLSEFLGAVTIMVILWFGGSIVLSGGSTLNAETFIGYIVLFYSVLQPAKALSNSISNIQKGDASAQRILEILETENTIVDKPDALEKKSFDEKIVFNDITFKYLEDAVIKNFSLEIKKGETVALVGQSGSGKSTIANLITRFYDVNAGTISMDGVDIKDMTKKSLRNLMGIVTQDSILFNDTVANNIKLAKQDATDNDVLDASEIANAHEFVKDLPEQYDTNIGDGGGKISGGQKQRLSIARAVLKNPPIMILDEATSALDTESELLVQKALEKMMENRTSIVIAHRLSTIQNANHIVVMGKGRILEQGKHEELLEQKGEYYKLVNMQSFT
ncbi:ABC transporter ATP-binding protein/permease [Flavobacteriaceae bacterium]|nr:ABC transporter ATP-binding protein/permease [Flavobacteriaceae bacterium]MDA9254178.1 ABC transporter ATP-binding protein/permease [Flavobacteriaceae bacterium]MDB4227998.1 ABC transporter ATP-binding protein/permease [Flavobacteriaceae bacterium]